MAAFSPRSAFSERGSLCSAVVWLLRPQCPHTSPLAFLGVYLRASGHVILVWPTPLQFQHLTLGLPPVWELRALACAVGADDESPKRELDE